MAWYASKMAARKSEKMFQTVEQSSNGNNLNNSVGEFSRSNDVLQTRREAMPPDARKRQNQFADYLMLAHSNQPIHHLESIADAGFLKPILNELSQRIKNMNRLQTYAWPHILRNQSLFLINTNKSGKTWSYLPPLCNNTYYDKMDMDPTYGPTAIILVASSKHVEQVTNNCKLLLSGLGNNAPVVVPSFGIRNFVETKVQLLNSCGILVITPSNLLRIFSDNKNEPLLDAKRLQHIIIDDMDLHLTCAKEDFETALKALLKFCKSSKANKILPQIVITSREWNSLLLEFIDLSNQPLLLFGDFLELSVYGRAELSIQLNSNLKKIELIRHYLKKNKENLTTQRRRTLIICNENSEVEMITKFLNEFNYPNIGYTKRSTNNERLAIDVWKRKFSNQILVCTDSELPELQIQNALNLIHYSMPNLWTQFTARFSVLALSYDNIICKKSRVFKRNTNKVRSLILLDENNGQQVQRLVRFMRKHDQILPQNIETVAKQIMIAGDQELFHRGVCMCFEMLEFGECVQPSCGYRHEIIFSDIITERDDIPMNGHIRIHILKVCSPTHYYSRLLEHKPLNSNKWFEVRQSRKFLEFNIKLDRYYSNTTNLIQHWPLKSNDICIYKYLHNYRRACVLHVPSSSSSSSSSSSLKPKNIKTKVQRRPVSVTLKLIDYGSIITGACSNEIFVCHNDFKKFPHQAIDIRLMNLVPNDNEREWDSDVTKEVRKWIMDDIKSDNVIEVEVNFAFANTVWINNLFIMEKLNAIETDRRLMSLKSSLINRKFASSYKGNGKSIRAMIDEYSLRDSERLLSESESNSDYYSFGSESVGDLSFFSAYSDESFNFGMETTKNIQINSEENKPKANRDELLTANEDENEKLASTSDSNETTTTQLEESWIELSLNELFKVEFGDENENGNWENIFFQLVDKSFTVKFLQLNELINKHIEKLKASSNDSLSKSYDLQPLFSCIVKHHDMYLRAKVVSIFGSESSERVYKFFFCDLACFTLVNENNLYEDKFYPTSKEILNFIPYQSIHCKLAGIQLNWFCKRYKVTKSFLYVCAVQEDSNKCINFPINSYKVLLYECEEKNDFKKASMFNKTLLDNCITIEDPDTKHFLELEIKCDDNNDRIEKESDELKVINFDELLERLQKYNELDIVNVKNFIVETQSPEVPKLEFKSLNGINELEENDVQSTFVSQNGFVELSIPRLENLYKRPSTTWYQTNYLIYLSIHVPDITDYYLKVNKDNVCFTAIVNGEECNLIMDLLGAVVPQLVCHELRGLNVTVCLVKSICIEWPRLLRNPGKFNWLTYNYDAVDDNQQDITTTSPAAEELLSQEDSDSDDSELDSYQTYNAVGRDEYDLDLR
uniref:RNA helicase n=1 Tax=Glossina brevipalpis TaxID=37001 RepID=A0A1A9X2D7_9MUSC